MERRPVPVFQRLLAVLLACALLWLAQQAGRAGIAGIYAAAAAQYQRPGQATASVAEGERKIALAREYTAGHAGYALQAASFAAARGDYDGGISLLLAALANTPVRADLWARLASYGYRTQGPSVMTLHALDRAMYLGPREYDSHLANATIVLGTGSQLDLARRLRGWNDMVEAARIPQLSGPITSMAERAGMARQLKGLISEKDRERAALEQRRREPRDAS
jgi:tetratricopeptide (TPR) repeat protein